MFTFCSPTSRTAWGFFLFVPPVEAGVGVFQGLQEFGSIVEDLGSVEDAHGRRLRR